MNGNLGTNIQVARYRAGYTQSTVAKAIGVSRPTYAQIEANEKDITLSQLDILTALMGVSINTLRPSADSTGVNRQIGEDSMSAYLKYKQMILNALQFAADTKDGKITKTKLAKIVYLADFTWYYDNLEPISGMSYRKLARGPVPNVYFRAVDELVEDGIVHLEESGRAFMLSMNESGDAPHHLLTTKQRACIKEIGRAWKDKQTAEIVDFTHAQRPWQMCRDGEVIPYSLITQESPAAVYGPAKFAVS